MSDPLDIGATVNRLKRIEGQVRGLIKMIEANKPCEDILIQISSAKSALHKTGQIVLESYLHKLILDGIKDADEHEAVHKLSSAIEQFSRMS